jgi:hypothetical protein
VTRRNARFSHTQPFDMSRVHKNCTKRFYFIVLSLMAPHPSACPHRRPLCAARHNQVSGWCIASDCDQKRMAVIRKYEYIVFALSCSVLRGVVVAAK